MVDALDIRQTSDPLKLPPALAEQSIEQSLSLSLLTDFDTLCAPHVPLIREVLTGKRYRHKITFHGATLTFYHGCLMAKVNHQGILYALPPFSVDKADGLPAITQLPEHQAQWLDDFMTLPKSILLFYFSLLKATFNHQPLKCVAHHPDTGKPIATALPQCFEAILAEAGWATA